MVNGRSEEPADVMGSMCFLLEGIGIMGVPLYWPGGDGGTLTWGPPSSTVLPLMTRPFGRVTRRPSMTRAPLRARYPCTISVSPSLMSPLLNPRRDSAPDPAPSTAQVLVTPLASVTAR